MNFEFQEFYVTSNRRSLREGRIGGYSILKAWSIFKVDVAIDFRSDVIDSSSPTITR